jgi:hypothetical protein
MPSLTRQFPDAGQEVRALFAWFGSGVGPWSGFPVYENVPAYLLLRHTPRELISALEATPLTDPEMEGAARLFSVYAYPTPVLTPAHFFSGPTYGPPVRTSTEDRRLIGALPANLKRSFMARVLTTGDPDNIARAREAFEK